MLSRVSRAQTLPSLVDSVLETPVIIGDVLTGLLVQRASIARRAPIRVLWKRIHANPSVPAFTLDNNCSGARGQTQLSASMFCMIRQHDKPRRKTETGKGSKCAGAQQPAAPAGQDLRPHKAGRGVRRLLCDWHHLQRHSIAAELQPSADLVGSTSKMSMFNHSTRQAAEHHVSVATMGKGLSAVQCQA